MYRKKRPSGKRLHNYWKWPSRKFVDLPSYKIVIFHTYVGLPEGLWGTPLIVQVQDPGVVERLALVAHTWPGLETMDVTM